MSSCCSMVDVGRENGYRRAKEKESNSCYGLLYSSHLTADFRAHCAHCSAWERSQMWV